MFVSCVCMCVCVEWCVCCVCIDIIYGIGNINFWRTMSVRTSLWTFLSLVPKLSSVDYCYNLKRGESLKDLDHVLDMDDVF